MVGGIDVGTASVNWGFDPLYTWIKPPAFGRMLDEMAQAGYVGTEISYNFPSDISVIQAARCALRRRFMRSICGIARATTKPLPR